MKTYLIVCIALITAMGSSVQASECKAKAEQFEAYVATTTDGIGSETQLVALAKSAVAECLKQAQTNKDRRLVRIIQDSKAACVQASDQMSSVYTAYCNSKIALLAVYLLP